MPSWEESALRCMRIPGQPEPYMSSYATGDDTWWGRNPVSSYRYRAALVQGRYPNPEAFDANINPDYSEVAYLDSTYRTITWSRINQWTQMVLGDTYKLNHTPGFIDNTRVMLWGAEVWIKSKATGLWTRRINENPLGGDWFSPSFRYWIGNKSVSTTGYRVESSTGYASIKLPMQASASGEPDYWLWHGFTDMVNIDPWDVADVVSSIKCSLVVDQPDLADDREYSRFLLGVGSDYMPDESRTTYPSMGGSRLKYVTARWPNWEFRVAHSMTQAQLEAANGYPSSFVGVSEGDGTVVDPDPGGGGTTWVWPHAVAEWQAMEVDTDVSQWGASGVSQTPYESGGMPPILRRRR